MTDKQITTKGWDMQPTYETKVYNRLTTINIASCVVVTDVTDSIGSTQSNGML